MDPAPKATGRKAGITNVYLPSEYVEPYLTCYFDVDVEHLPAYDRYNPQEGTYRIPDQPHGYNDIITDVTMDGDILTITYQHEVIPERGTKVTMDGNIRVITYDDEARSKQHWQKGELPQVF